MNRKACLGMVATLTWLALADRAAAQITTTVPATGITPPQEASSSTPPIYADSACAFIDSAIPRTMLRLRYDLDYTNHRPTRAEYLFPKGGTPGAPGMLLPETNVSMQELWIYGELALTPHFAFFTEQPFRWVNPDINANESGLSDLNLGLKWVLPFSTDTAVTTVQLRAYIPTGGGRVFGTDHVSLEPALLINYGITNYLTLEGEVRYWVPLGGTDFAGDILRYGLGLVYGMKASNEIWLTPVAEVVGWTVLDGQQQVATSATNFWTEGASGTIINGCLGLRVGLGDRADVYAGYSRCFTGPAWFRDMARVELRLFF
jgi:hypothetical protein